MSVRLRSGPLVFGDAAQLSALNSIVWPAIRALMGARIFSEAAVLRASGGKDGFPPLVVFEAAVLVEAKWQDLADEVWVTTVSPEVAKARLMRRNNLSEADAGKRVASQLSNEQRRAASHVEVSNDGDEAALLAQVRARLAALKARYSKLSALECVDVVDVASDQVQTHCKRAVVRMLNLPHRCSYVVVRQRKSGRVLVQVRSELKDAGPGLLDPAPGGVLAAGESYEANARREMAEEMGLRELHNLRLVCVFYHDHALDGRSWGSLFCCETDCELHQLVLQEDEVKQVRLLTVAEVLSLPEAQLLPCGLAAFKRFAASKHA